MPVLRNHSLSYALDKLKDTHTEQIIIGDGSEVMEQFHSQRKPSFPIREYSFSVMAAA